MVLVGLSLCLFAGLLSFNLEITNVQNDESAITSADFTLLDNLVFANRIAAAGKKWVCTSNGENTGDCIAVSHPNDTGVYCGGGCGGIFDACDCSGSTTATPIPAELSMASAAL